MNMARILLIAAASYLLGSIPFGYILVRTFRGEDVRRTGSGNIGATNVARRSPGLGVLTLLLDALKGSGAVLCGILMSLVIPGSTSPNHISLHEMIPASSPDLVLYAAVAALFAVAGHMFPVWLNFRGGKGVATGLGAFVMIAPKAVLFSAIIFVGLIVLSRYVSLGSIVAVAAFPNIAMALREYGNNAVALVLMAVASVLIVIKHHANIQRLLAGTENRLGTKHS